MFEFADEKVGVGLGEAERWQQAQHVGSGASGETMLLMDERHTHVLVENVEVDSYHQAATTHLKDMGLGLLQFLELANEILAHLMGIVDEVLLVEHIEHGEGCGASQMVAAEGGSELSLDRNEAG